MLFKVTCFVLYKHYLILIRDKDICQWEGVREGTRFVLLVLNDVKCENNSKCSIAIFPYFFLDYKQLIYIIGSCTSKNAFK